MTTLYLNSLFFNLVPKPDHQKYSGYKPDYFVGEAKEPSTPVHVIHDFILTLLQRKIPTNWGFKH
jgi:hypothetical protein